MTNTTDDELQQQIEQAADKLKIEPDFLRQITPEEIEYLLDRCPFLQIVGPETLETPGAVKIIRASSGWDIHDYGDAMSSSPGSLLFGGGDFRIYLSEIEANEGGSLINPGKGTLVNQAFMTAREMIEIANSRGWSIVTIVDGHRIMKRAAWIQAEILGLVIDGFEPTEEDKRIRELFMESKESFELRRAVIHKNKPSI